MQSSNSNLMYTAVNALIVHTLFINLEYVHDREQVDSFTS